MCGGNIVRKTKLEHIICAQRDSKVRINKTKCIVSLVQGWLHLINGDPL